MNHKKFSGVIAPTVTPLTPSFELDEAGVERIFALLYEHAVSPFILGTTGEAASLPFSVKEQYVKVAGKNKKTGTVLYAGISSTVVNETIKFAGFCGEHGVDAVAVTVHDYYALNETEMRKYFELLANTISIPLIIYNIPSTTHMSIPLHLVDELSFHPNIVAIKDSERSEERLRQSLALCRGREEFGYLQGWAAKSVYALTGGADGLIPSTANFAPGIYQQMLAAVNGGDQHKAQEMQAVSDAYGNIYQNGKSLGQSLWALKVLMQRQGLCEDVMMPPLQPMHAAEKKNLVDSFEKIKQAQL